MRHMTHCTQKHCNSCGKTKPIEEFTKSKVSTNFKTAASQYHSYCKECNAKRARDWRAARPSYRGSGRINNIPESDRLLMSAIRQRLTDAKVRCKKLKRDAPELTDTYLYKLMLSQEKKCALTGVDLALETGNPLCLSLDQIDPGKGYVEGNVQWLAWCVNRAKGDLHQDDFFEMCKVVLDWKEQRLSKGSKS